MRMTTIPGLRGVRTLPGRLGRRAVAMGVVATVVVAGAVFGGVEAFGGPAPTRITAYFDQTVAVYAGSDLRVLGVKVGTVRSVTPQGKQVKVVLELDHGVKVPAGADAVVVAPSVVADRYVQLAPAYTGGPQMPSGATIPVTRTATPVELDQLYASITNLTTALGPDGVNSQGALSDVLTTGAKNLKGNGQAIGNSIQQFGAASRTLAGNSQDLFSTLENLQKFTTMLKNNDGQVRTAEQQLSQVTGFLADDRQSLGSALQELATALSQAQGFIHDNRARLKSNVDKLASITQVLVDERASLTEALNDAPLAADNVLNAYDPVHRTLDGRGDLNELSMGPAAGALASSATTSATSATATMASQLCAVTGTSSGGLCAGQNAVHGDALVPVTGARLTSLPPLPLPTVGTVYGSTRSGGGR